MVHRVQQGGLQEHTLRTKRFKEHLRAIRGYLGLLVIKALILIVCC